MNKSLQTVVNKAHEPAGPTVTALPSQVLMVQMTPEYEELVNVAAPNLGFKVVDPIAFTTKKLNLRLGITVPVFGFFNVAEVPTIRGEAKCGFEEKPTFEWVSNKYQPASIKPTDAFGLFERLYLQYSTEMITAFVWFIVIIAMSFGYAWVASTEKVHLGEMLVIALAVAALPIASGISGFLNKVKLRRAATKTYSVQLHNIIPEHVVLLINEHEAKKTFNKGMYIVADVADAWRMNRELTWIFGDKKPGVDPLLIGVHNANNVDSFHIVYVFDLDTADKFVTQPSG